MNTHKDLSQKKCVPCSGHEPPMDQESIALMHVDVPDWKVKDVKGVPHLQRSFKFDDFAQALDFTNQVGQAAEAEGHHPLIRTEWGKVTVSWWTHKINGLHQNDFVMAAKTDKLFEKAG